MTKPIRTETWKPIGSVARILAGKLLVARELEKMAAAPTGESDGRGAPPREETPSVMADGEMVATAQEGRLGKAQAVADARGVRASEIQTVGTVPA